MLIPHPTPQVSTAFFQMKKKKYINQVEAKYVYTITPLYYKNRWL